MEDNEEQTVIQKIKSINFPDCPIHKEIVSEICVLETCAKYYKAGCSQCIDDHPEHSIKYIKNLRLELIRLSSDLIQNSSKQNSNNLFSLLNHEDYKNQIMATAENYKKLKEKCDLIKQNIQKNCNELIEKSDEESDRQRLENFISIIRGQNLKDAKTLQDGMDKLKECILIIDFNNIKFQSKQLIIYKNEVTKSYRELNSKLEEIISYTKEYEKFESEEIQNYIFSQTLKSNRIKIVEKNKVAKSMVNTREDNRGLALVDYVVKNDRSQSIAFKINSIVEYIAIGICLKNQIVNSKFKYDGKFVYMVCFNGEIWTHTPQNQKIMDYKFQYEQDEIINVIFDPLEKTLIFQNLTEEDMFMLKIDIPQDEQCYFCVYLHRDGDSISIL